MSLLPAVKLWIWVSVLASLAGWSLSALGALTRLGYVVFGFAAAAVFLAGRKAFGWEAPVGWFNWRRLQRRFRRWLPASFALLSLLVFLGGALYPPSNHAGFTYRTPRVLHWLMAGHWHWIHTPDYRMNDRACGFEWLTAPLILFTKTDRALFLINFLSFLLLPGLTFSVFTRLGVRPRAAWYWMWLLPTGYSFLLQAGSTANDTFPTVYALAAVDFGLRAWGRDASPRRPPSASHGRLGEASLPSRRASDLWLSILAAGLLTGAKASNLTLLLPWAIVVAPSLPVLLRRPLATAGVVLLAGAVSFLPSAALNVRYCGDWSGLSLEKQGMDMKNPLVGVWGNALLLLKNFVPPFFPLAGKWNASALTVLPRAVVEPMKANFEPGFHRWDSLAQLRATLPKELRVVGFLGHGDDVDISLWRPFFSRRVEHILLQDTPEQIRQRHIEYIVVSGGYLAGSGMQLAEWLQRTGAEVLGKATVTQTVTRGPQPWYVVRLR
ncbi:MAG TPA: hypothetical protein VMU04_12795 [Candidatus Acidoferrum sp.]|nr:hypothetical protein [Candidatus Acidoferrum sp.]